MLRDSARPVAVQRSRDAKQEVSPLNFVPWPASSALFPALSHWSWHAHISTLAWSLCGLVLERGSDRERQRATESEGKLTKIGIQASTRPVPISYNTHPPRPSTTNTPFYFLPSSVPPIIHTSPRIHASTQHGYPGASQTTPGQVRTKKVHTLPRYPHPRRPCRWSKPTYSVPTHHLSTARYELGLPCFLSLWSGCLQSTHPRHSRRQGCCC